MILVQICSQMEKWMAVIAGWFPIELELGGMFFFATRQVGDGNLQQNTFCVGSHSQVAYIW